MPLTARRLIAIGYDATVACLAWTIAFIVRYNVALEPEPRSVLLGTLPVVLGIQVGCFVWFGLYRGIWRYASMHDMKRIVMAVGTSALLVPFALLLWRHGIGVPRVLYFVNPLMLVLFMGGGRIVYRWWKEHRQFRSVRRQGKPVLLVGAGDGSRQLLAALERSPAWQVVGLLDDNPRRVGRDIAGFPVLGTWDDLPDVAQRTACRHALLATADGDAAARRRVFGLCEQAGIHLLVAPDVGSLIRTSGKAPEIRQFELDDLLGREPVQLDTDGLSHQLGDRVVLVTGAGGSIGSELCRQIARFSPRELVLVESNEYALYRIHELLQRLYPELSLSPVIADVKDRRRVTGVFDRFRPAIVFHAAAYKHVPLLEEGNAWEAVRNNVVGTLVVASASARVGVDKFVLVSTDKAVNPTNVMGATKRLAELMLQDLRIRVGLPAVIVRFGNVLGSSGSAIPKFREQIARGGPVTVTHPEVTRYFMSIPEATQLVLQAGLMGRDGEIFVLDMGQPIRIVDLARDMIRLSGFDEQDISIEFTGLRPGEKLFEELLAGDETTLATYHPKIRIARSTEPPDASWQEQVSLWLDSESPQRDAAVRGWLRRFVPEYAPPVSLDVDEPAERLVRPSATPAAGLEGPGRQSHLTLIAGRERDPLQPDAPADAAAGRTPRGG